MRSSKSEPESIKSLWDQAISMERVNAKTSREIAEKILALEASHIGALSLLARIAFATRNYSDAVELLYRAISFEPLNGNLQRSLGIALIEHGALNESIEHLKIALSLDPNLHNARLHLGRALELSGETMAATRAYFHAITNAQMQEQWLVVENIPIMLRPYVLHGQEFVQRHRGELFLSWLGPLHRQFGAVSMQRVVRALKNYLGEIHEAPISSNQRPKFLFFPGLPTNAFFDLDLFPWLNQFRDRWKEIKGEAIELLERPNTLEPFLDIPKNGLLNQYLTLDQTQIRFENQPEWNAFFFYRHGNRYDANHAICKITSRTIEAAPLVKISEHAPEICFSFLSPGTMIRPHHGVTNVRLVAHLPLIVPNSCGLRVDNGTHYWREGEPVVFDDTFEHEAWNRSTSTRVILLMDCWNPYLTLEERIALTQIIEGIGDFHRKAID